MSWPSREPAAPNPVSAERARNSTRRTAAGYSREVVLLGYFGLMLVLLSLTAFISRMYHKEVHVLADRWFRQGEARFEVGDAGEAVKDYRNALVYSPGNAVFQLHLAQALVAAEKDAEARSYLLNLLAESPGSGEINLDLARLAARERGSIEDALRYYYGAIYGGWDSNAIEMRWDVRRELCEYLLAHGTTPQAQPEIIALAQDVPAGDPARQKEAGQLLLRVQLWNRALDEYRAILVSHRNDGDALAGAGTAAFQMGQYALAIQYFDDLPPEKRTDPEISAMLEVARETQAADPSLPDLSNQERARRTVKALGRAEALARQCSERQGPPPSTSRSSILLQGLLGSREQASPLWTEGSLWHHPDEVDSAMQWVFQAENAAAQICGEPQSLADRALLLIARSRTNMNHE
jgi:tetratricopeptide (TPR) repeat protein